MKIRKRRKTIERELIKEEVKSQTCDLLLNALFTAYILKKINSRAYAKLLKAHLNNSAYFEAWTVELLRKCGLWDTEIIEVDA